MAQDRQLLSATIWIGQRVITFVLLLILAEVVSFTLPLPVIFFVIIIFLDMTWILWQCNMLRFGRVWWWLLNRMSRPPKTVIDKIVDSVGLLFI